MIGDYPQDREPMEGWNEAHAAAAARHRVVLAGTLAAAFDLFGFVSRLEPGPIAPLEAMAHAVPVVTWRVGILPEIIDDGLNGFIVEQGDIDGFVDRVAGLVRDREALRRVGDAGRATIGVDLSPAVTERKIEDVYRAVIGSRPPARPAGRSGPDTP